MVIVKQTAKNTAPTVSNAINFFMLTAVVWQKKFLKPEPKSVVDSGLVQNEELM